MNIIVRADFYPDGSIIPIGITYPNGDSAFISAIEHVRLSMSKGGMPERCFLCHADKGTFWLSFVNNQWTLSPMYQCES